MDIAAPGVNVLSTFIDLNGSQSGSLTGAYGRISGTSMSTPMVAAVAALVKSEHPSWSPQQVAAQVLATADNIDSLNPQFAGKLGAGRVNAYRAVTETVSAPQVIAIGGLGPNGGTIHRLEVDNQISVQFSEAMNSATVLNAANYQLINTDTNTPIALDIASDYSPFPGEGIRLRIREVVPDGHYQFRVSSAGIQSQDGTPLAADVTLSVQVTPQPITTSLHLPFGALVYQGSANDQLTETVPTFVPSGAGGLDGPSGLVRVGNDLYVSSFHTGAVLRFNATTGAFEQAFVAPGSGGLVNADGLIFGPDINGDGYPELYVSDRSTSSVMRYDGQTGAPLPAPGNTGAQFIAAGSGGLNQPSGLTFGPDGNLYVTSWGNSSIMRYNGATGAPMPSAGNTGATFVSPGTSGLSGTPDAEFGPDGNLYVTSFDTDAILRFDGTTGAFVDTIVPSGRGGLDGPVRIVFGPDGRLDVVSFYSQSVLQYDLSGNFVGTLVKTNQGGLYYPVGLAFDTQNKPYVAGFGTDIILHADGTNAPGDVDNFAIPLDGSVAETATVEITSTVPDPSVSFTFNGVAATTPADEDPGPGRLYQVVGNPGLAGPGILQIAIQSPDGLTIGSYSIKVTLNALKDNGDNNTLGQAESLDRSLINADPGAGTFERAAVVGSLTRTVAKITTETEGITNDLRGSWTLDPSTGHWTINGGAGVTGSLNSTSNGFNKSNDGGDSYRIDLRAGETISVRTKAASSGGGTLAQALLELDGPTISIVGTPVAPNSSDYTLTSTAPVAGEYIITVFANSSEKGTYTLTADLQAFFDPRPDTLDLYSISLTAGVPISIGADSGVSDPRVQLALFGPGVDPLTGTALAKSTVRGTLDAILEYVPSVSGSFTIDVTRANPLADSVDYGLVVTVGGDFNRGDNQSGDLSAAPPTDPAKMQTLRNNGSDGQVLGFASATGGPAPAGTYYGFDVYTNTLFTIDPYTGLIEHLPVASSARIDGLAYNPSNPGILYALDQFHDVLYTLNRSTGASTQIGRLSVDLAAAMVYNPKNGKLYGWKNGGTLVEINPATGKGKVVGVTANANFPDSSAMVVDTNPASATYGRLLVRDNHNGARSYDVSLAPGTLGVVTAEHDDGLHSYGAAFNGREYVASDGGPLYAFNPDTNQVDLRLVPSEFPGLGDLTFAANTLSGTPYLNDPRIAYFQTVQTGTLRLETPGTAAGDFPSDLVAHVDVWNGTQWIPYTGQSLNGGTMVRVVADSGSGPFVLVDPPTGPGAMVPTLATPRATSGGTAVTAASSPSVSQDATAARFLDASIPSFSVEGLWTPIQPTSEVVLGIPQQIQSDSSSSSRKSRPSEAVDLSLQ